MTTPQQTAGAIVSNELTPEQESERLFIEWYANPFSIRPLAVYEAAKSAWSHQQAKIDALTIADTHQKSLIAALIDTNKRLEAERDAALAQLRAAREQKPICWIANANRYWLENKGTVPTEPVADENRFPLYAAPVPAQPVTREGCNYLAMQGTVCNKCGEIHK